MKQFYFRWMLLMSAIFVLGGLKAKKVHTLGDSTMAFYNESTTNICTRWA